MARSRLHGIPWVDVRLLIEAALLAGIIRAGLAFVTLRTLRRLLEIPPRWLASRRASDVDRIAWAVTAASNRIPGASCLVRALAADALLRRRRIPSRLRIAVRRCGPRGLDGHAWVETEDRTVVGAVELAGYVSIPRLDTERLR